MEYVYAALILNEADEEINEDNLTAILEAANVDVEESRVKALVAALEDVDISEAIEQAGAVPAAVSAPAAGEAEEAAGDEPDAEETDDEAPDAADDDEDDEDEEASGEGLGALFG